MKNIYFVVAEKREKENIGYLTSRQLDKFIDKYRPRGYAFRIELYGAEFSFKNSK